jgi:hypothetical protein
MKEAVGRLVREQSFTILNRFAAMRMAEERGIILESIANGMNSRGFKVYEQTSGRALGTAYERYRTFVYCLWDELSIDLGALFDRFSPYGLLFPREKSLEKLFEVLNDREIAHLWKEDETIGWIYQYFNSKEEREAMRRASQAPRNSRELAVRNQFFTPRYVVEFLTDNTLGRIWYEMTRGNTRLKEVCRYMVRRPNEIFLDKGEEPPERKSEEQEKSGEELLKEPVYIPFRRIKGPREILMLDPACGSMHFGLYAFDLYEAIYEEAWDNYPELLSDLRQKVSGKEEFLRLVPELIIRFNIHGIDIDHRAVQIANLSLWLRAQKSWKKQELKSNQRPTITRSNVVCAEPMPGEKQFLEEFTASLQPPILGKLVEVIWEKMQLAGEAGALLKIEEEISSAIEEAKREWTEIKAPFFQKPLFKEFEMSMQKEFKFPVYDVEEDFWQEAEKRVIDALKEFSEKAVSGQSYQRQMFSEEVVQGFSFIDICRKKYDVVLMNPPFGEFSRKFKGFALDKYPNTYNDIFAAFTELWYFKLKNNGRLGAITSRTGFFLSSFRKWRENFMISLRNLILMMDLGLEVMDDAMVESAAYVLCSLSYDYETTFIRILGVSNRESVIVESIKSFCQFSINDLFFTLNIQACKSLPFAPLVYWVSSNNILNFSKYPTLEPEVAQVRQGLVTGDNTRFTRGLWEVPYEKIQTQNSFNSNSVEVWAPLVMKGESQPWYSPITVVVNWQKDGKEIKCFVNSKGKLQSRPQNTQFYFRPGFSWTRRAVRFIPYAIPSGCIPTASRYMAFPNPGQEYTTLGVTASNIASAFLRFYGERFYHPNFLVENLKALPWPDMPSDLIDKLENLVKQEVAIRRRAYQNYEPFHDFTAPNMLFPNPDSKAITCDLNSFLGHKLELEVAAAYGFSPEQAETITRDLQEAVYAQSKGSSGSSVSDDESDGDVSSDFVLINKDRSLREEIISYVIGSIFGRWDIRIAMDSSLAPELPGPFDPLPVCPPGMLVGTDGLPAKPGGIVSEEWLRARPNAITLPPDNSVKNPTITDDKYPLRISRDGILVDDSTAVSGQSHPEDIVHRVREVLNLLWKDKAFEIEQEICDFLKIKDLETYFQKPAGFFQDHLKRYSKSRRQAPIYWPLSSASGSYTLWIYYHRLNDQTLYKCVNDFIVPKIREKERMLDKKRAEIGEAASLLQKQELEKDMNFLQELNDFKNELIRIAELPYKPNLNDGVLITAAPLYNLFRLPKWKKDLKTCWEKLENGEYDWAHLAYSVWPERVKAKCKTDKSLAIAHNLEALYEEPPPKKRK